MEDLKLRPYNRLKAVIKDDDISLSDKAQDNLDAILGIEKKVENSFLTKIKNLFKMIDSKIFTKPDRMWNTTYHKRK